MVGRTLRIEMNAGMGEAALWCAQHGPHQADLRTLLQEVYPRVHATWIQKQVVIGEHQKLGIREPDQAVDIAGKVIGLALGNIELKTA